MILSTGVGSLPFLDFSKAVDYVIENYGLAFLPETLDPRSPLPAMLTHLLDDQQLACYCASDWTAFKTTLQSNNSFYSAVYDIQAWHLRTRNRPRKLQIIGPRTLINLFTAQFPNQHSAEIESVAFELLANRLQRLQETFDRSENPIYLCFDEPTLNDRNIESTSEMVSSLMRVANLDRSFRMGVHCCAPISIELYAKVFAYLGLSFDMNQTSGSPEEVKEKWLPAEFSSPVMLSGGCGTGTQTLFFEEAVCESLKAAVSFLQASMVGNQDT
jgi:hypothetical protein